MVRSLSRRAFTLVALLSTVAGFVDGFGFRYLGGYFVSFMSGNTTRASVETVAVSWAAAGSAVALIAAFVVGAGLGTLVPGAPVRHETRVLLLTLALLTTGAVAATLGSRLPAGVALAAAMGAMNTVFARGGEVSFGITYMTGSLVKLGQALAVVTRPGRRMQWARPLLRWLAIALGAMLGATAYAIGGAAAVWVPVGVLALLVAVPALRRWAHA